MIFIFKIAVILINIIADIFALFMAMGAMKAEHLRLRGSANVNNYKKFFKRSIIASLVSKFVYWLFIPDTSNIVTTMFAYSILVYMIIIISAFVFLLPLHKFNREKYQKCPAVCSAYWGMCAMLAILFTFVLSFFISAPIIVNI